MIEASRFIPVNQPSIGELEKKYILQALDTGWISSDGPFVEEFEKRFAVKVDREHGIAVSNGTVALEIALQALNIAPGDEVIVPSFTIISCLNAILKVGAVPRFIDCYPDTWNMDVDQIEENINKKTKAILVVHIYGLPTEMKKVLDLAKTYNLKVIEDAAEAHGQRYFDRPCGSFGDISTFSFYANKHITMGEGGLIATNNDQVADFCRSQRNLFFKAERRFIHDEIGTNARLTNLQAAIGLAQLEKLYETISRKKKIGKIYSAGLADIDAIQTPVDVRDGYENHFWVYGIVMRDDRNAKEIMNELAEAGIGTRPFFWPLHKQPLLEKYDLQEKVHLPISERIAEKGFYLPSGVAISDSEIERVIFSLKKVLNNE